MIREPADACPVLLQFRSVSRSQVPGTGRSGLTYPDWGRGALWGAATAGPATRPPKPEPALAAGDGDPGDPMVAVGQWTGALACALWIASRDNIHDFAGWLGVGSSTVEGWKDNPGIVPTPTSQRVLDEALCRLDNEAKRRFALLVGGIRPCGCQTRYGRTENGARANRRSLAKAAAAGFAAVAVPPEVAERIAAAAAGPGQWTRSWSLTTSSWLTRWRWCTTPCDLMCWSTRSPGRPIRC